MSKFVLALDSSQIHSFQTCPLKWFYRYNQNLRLDTKQAVAPDKGTLVHSLLDMYYTARSLDPNGNKLQQANAAIEGFKKVQAVKQLFPTDDGSLEQFICERFMFYVTRYISDDFSVLRGGVEVGFSHAIYEDEEILFILEGRIDLINSIQRNPCFTDHKTQDRKSNIYHFTPQFKTYALVTGYEYGMINYFGMQKDYKEGNTFRRDLIHFDKELIIEWKEKCIRTFYEIKQFLQSPIPELAIYPYRNDSACEGKFGYPCEFSNICEVTNREMKESIKSFKYKVGPSWRPW